MGAIPLLASLRRGPRTRGPSVRLTPPPAPAGGPGFGYTPPGEPSSPLGWVSAHAPAMPTGIGVHEPGGGAPPQHEDGLGQLEKLKKLHDEGALSDAEFATAKAKLLSEL